MPLKSYITPSEIVWFVYLISLASLAQGSHADENPYNNMIAKIHTLQDQEYRGFSISETDVLESLLHEPTRHSGLEREETQATAPLLITKPGSAKLPAKGLEDPHFPVKMDTLPERIPIPTNLRFSALEKYIEKGSISFSKLKPKVLEQLSDTELRELLTHFNQIPLEIQWKDKNGSVRSGKSTLKISHESRWSKTTATGALALQLGILQQSPILGKVLSFAPKESLEALRGEAISVLNVDIISYAIVYFLIQSSQASAQQTALHLKNIVYIYLEYWAGKSPDRMMISFASLILTCKKIIHQHQIDLSLKQKGVLLGALFSGSLDHARSIKSTEERRLWIINSISNLSWAATAFIGAIPILGSITCAIAAVASIGAVTWAVIFNKKGVTDSSPKIKELEGSIEFSVLESAEQTGKREIMQDALEVLAWMRATIHMNGHAD